MCHSALTIPSSGPPGCWHIWHLRVGGPRQGSYLAELALQLLPRVPGITAGVDLAEEASSQDALRVRRMSGQRPDVRIGLHRQGPGLPGRATVCGTLDRSSAADRRIPEGRKEDVGVVRLDGDATAVAQGKALSRHHRLPALAQVGRGEDFTRRTGQDLLGRAQADGHTVNIRVYTTGDMGPGVPPIQAPVDAIHLHPGPDDV